MYGVGRGGGGGGGGVEWGCKQSSSIVRKFRTCFYIMKFSFKFA